MYIFKAHAQSFLNRLLNWIQQSVKNSRVYDPIGEHPDAISSHIDKTIPGRFFVWFRGASNATSGHSFKARYVGSPKTFSLAALLTARTALC